MTTEKIINKVPHPVNVLDDENRIIRVFPKSNGMVRLKQVLKPHVKIDGISINKLTFTDPEGLPPYVKGTYYIVSQLVKSALPERLDLLVSTGIIRDKDKNIIGCKYLSL